MREREQAHIADGAMNRVGAKTKAPRGARVTRFPGDTCSVCGEPILVGELRRTAGRRKAHDRCEK